MGVAGRRGLPPPKEVDPEFLRVSGRWHSSELHFQLLTPAGRSVAI